MRLIVRDLKKLIDEALVVNKISYSFEAGKLYSISGKSRYGISVLFSCICGQIRLDSGDIRMDAGGRVFKASYTDFAILDDNMVTPDYLTVRQFIDYCIELHGEGNEDTEYYLNFAGLDAGIWDEIIRELTEEERTTLRLLAVMITSPTVIMLERNIEGIQFAERFIEYMKPEHIIIMTNNEELSALADVEMFYNRGRINSFDLSEEAYYD